MASSLPHLGLKLLGEGSHVDIQLDGAESVPELLLLVLAEGVEVVGDAALEQHRLLRHDGEPLPQEADMGARDVLPVDLDSPSADERHAEQRHEQRALACSSSPADANLFSRLDSERDGGEDVGEVGAVAHGEVGEADLSS
eukprot:758941-Hanusia_phi.AAC.10